VDILLQKKKLLFHNQGIQLKPFPILFINI